MITDEFLQVIYEFSVIADFKYLGTPIFVQDYYLYPIRFKGFINPRTQSILLQDTLILFTIVGINCIIIVIIVGTSTEFLGMHEWY